MVHYSWQAIILNHVYKAIALLGKLSAGTEPAPMDN
jgi:hypothetical protein